MDARREGGQSLDSGRQLSTTQPIGGEVGGGGRKGGRGWVEAAGAASHRAEDANSAFNQRLGEDEKHPLAQTMVASGCVTMNPLLPES